MAPYAQAGILLINTLGGLYLLAIMLRLLFQLARADFYNPFSQAIVKITNPAVKFFRSFVPGYNGIDFSSLILALMVQILCTVLMALLATQQLLDIGVIISWSAIGLLSFTLNIYFWALLISIIASWIAPHSHNPAVMLARQLTEPIMSQCRKIIPPMGGLDLSPIFIFLGIQIIELIVLKPVAMAIHLSPALVIGI